MNEPPLSCQLIWMHNNVYSENPFPIDKSSLKTYDLVRCMFPVVSIETNCLFDYQII
jgi:hypothetical protein